MIDGHKTWASFYGVPEHTEEDFAAARAFFATNHDAWFKVDGKLAISRESITGERYDPNQGGWAYL